MIALDVAVAGGGWDLPGDLEATVGAAAEAAVRQAGATEPLTAALLLTDDAALRDLNRTWRGRDAPTNVLSFPFEGPSPPGGPRHLGDVALAWETVNREAASEGKAVRDHVAHLVVHGVLHLLGFDHGTDAEADAMEGAEAAALASVGVRDPYRETA